MGLQRPQKNEFLMETNQNYRRRERESDGGCTIRSKHAVAGLADFLKTPSCLVVRIIPKIISPVNVAMAITVQSSLPRCCSSVNTSYSTDPGSENSFP